MKKNDASPVAVSEEYEFYPMDHPDIPRGKRCLALTIGGVTVQEIFTSANIQNYEGWFPLPKKRKVNPTAGTAGHSGDRSENNLTTG